MTLKVFFAILQTFVIMGLGSFAMHRKMMRSENLPGLTKIGMDIFLPFLTFSSITANFSIRDLKQLWIMPVIGFALMLVSYLLGFLFRNLLWTRTPERKATLHHLCTINNFAFLPLIILDNLWGSRHVALILVMNVGFTVGLWTLGVISLTGFGNMRQNLRNIFNVNLIAVVIALLFCLLQLPIPEVVSKTASMMGAVAVPFVIFLTGAALYENAGKLFQNLPDAFFFIVLRLVIIPAILLALLYLLPISREMREVSAVTALMPAAVISVLIASRYGGSDDYAGQAIVTTTLAALITVPIWLAILL